MIDETDVEAGETTCETAGKVPGFIFVDSISINLHEIPLGELEAIDCLCRTNNPDSFHHVVSEERIRKMGVQKFPASLCLNPGETCPSHFFCYMDDDTLYFARMTLGDNLINYLDARDLTPPDELLDKILAAVRKDVQKAEPLPTTPGDNLPPHHERDKRIYSLACDIDKYPEWADVRNKINEEIKDKRFTNVTETMKIKAVQTAAERFYKRFKEKYNLQPLPRRAPGNKPD